MKSEAVAERSRRKFVIEAFVYPEDWIEHLSWATLLLFILTRGPGAIALDRWLAPLVLGRR